MNSIYHVPALKDECIKFLSIKPNGIYVDATFGGGGHTCAILEKLTDGHVFGFDQDTHTQKNIPLDTRFTWIHDNFSKISLRLKEHGVEQVDGILADLGVSFHQFDNAERGFSFRFENADLDMRMNPNSPVSAITVLNEYSENQLADVFYYYGEIQAAKKLAHQIVQQRKISKIQKVKDLIQLCSEVYPEYALKNYLPQIFQAIRIEVNQELEHLKSFLKQSISLLKSGGRLVIISYHSLEDRLVKYFMRSGNFEGILEKDFYGNIQVPWKLITKKPVQPNKQEILINPRARSAKLRVAEKI